MRDAYLARREVHCQSSSLALLTISKSLFRAFNLTQCAITRSPSDEPILERGYGKDITKSLRPSSVVRLGFPHPSLQSYFECQSSVRGLLLLLQLLRQATFMVGGYRNELAPLRIASLEIFPRKFPRPFTTFTTLDFSPPCD
jgi:hypothetical protein